MPGSTAWRETGCGAGNPGGVSPLLRVRTGGVTKVVEVVRIIQKRVGAPDAATCFLDRTPKPPPEALMPVARRDRGTGRPTKRYRRVLDRFRQGS